MTPTIAMIGTAIGSATAGTSATLGTMFATEHGNLDAISAALYALALASAIGVIALIRLTLKAIATPLNEQVPIIASAATWRLLNRLRRLVHLEAKPYVEPGTELDGGYIPAHAAPDQELDE